MGVGRREEDRDPEGGDTKVQSAVCFQKRVGAERECLHFFSWLPSGGPAALETNLSPKCSPCPWDTGLGLEGEQFQRQASAAAGQAARVQRGATG